ncbi:MAG: preprotein translocase subunit SecE [Pseudomonadota bacterium]
MTAQSESASSSVLDVVKLVFAVTLIVGGIGAFYYFAEQPLLYRVLGLVGVASISVVALFTTTTGRTVGAFIFESRAEVRKVVWPSRQETVQTTLIVIAMVFIVGLILWLLDMFLFWGVRMLTGQGG